MDENAVSPKLKATLEFGPLLGFFVAYLLLKDRVFSIGGTDYQGFIIVTAAFVPIFLLSIALLRKLTGHLSKMQIVTAVLIVVFGGLTVWFNDPKFFQMKPTIIYVFFSAVLGFGLLRGTSYLQYVMDGLMPLTDKGWMILTRRIMVFFFVLAILNELVWRTMSETTWVYFKTFGLTAAIFLFFMTQGKLFSEHGTDDAEGS
ncbi:MAG: inner membrane-spanning protein YciB [Pseudomonadota bacterium]